MATAYAKWLTAKGRPFIEFSGAKVGGFISFSEFWSVQHNLDARELKIVSSVISSAKGRKIAFDVGANLGLFSLGFASAGYTEVHSFEPIPTTYARLRANLALNPKLEPRIITNMLGLGSSEGSFTFVVDPKSPATNKFGTGEAKLLPGECPVECKVTTLDSYAESRGLDEVLFLKVDVEGFECEVLRGAKCLLGRGAVHFLYAEIIPELLTGAGSSVDEFAKLITSFGFEPVVLRADGSAGPKTVSLEEALAESGDRHNVLFRHRGSS